MKSKSKKGMGLHKHIATGGKPKDYQGASKDAVANKSKKK